MGGQTAHRHFRHEIGKNPSHDGAALQSKAATRRCLGSIFQHPFTWSLIGGRLPKGLKLEERGVISGTPTETGRFQIQVQVTDSIGTTDSASFSLESKADVAPEIVTTQTNLGSYSAGETIKGKLKAKGGNGKLKWDIEVPEGFDKMQDFGLEFPHFITYSWDIRQVERDIGICWAVWCSM